MHIHSATSQTAISIRSITSRLIVMHHATGRTREWTAWHGEFDDFQLVEARRADQNMGSRLLCRFPQTRPLSSPPGSLIAIFATLAALPNIRWSKRFSLRVFLIVTTLLALALGVVLYAERN